MTRTPKEILGPDGRTVENILAHDEEVAEWLEHSEPGPVLTDAELARRPAAGRTLSPTSADPA